MCVAVRLLGVVQIVHDDPIAAFARRGAADRGGTHDALAGIPELAFDILIGGELHGVAPPCLVPLRLHQGATVEGQLQRERVAVAHTDPASTGGRDPLPHGPEHGHEEGLHVPRRQVDQESRGLTRRDRFQVLADQINMPVRQKRCRRFEHGPGLFHERPQRAGGLPGEEFILELGVPTEWVMVHGALPR